MNTTRPASNVPQRLFITQYGALDAVLLVLRRALAIVIFPHGAQKMLGWFGGYGFAGTMQFFTGMMHIPAFLAVLAILAEFLGSILVALGFFTRLAALAIVVNMVVAVATIHLQNGFFMNWSGQQKGEGEFFVFAIAIGLVVAIAGPGKYALDARIASSSLAA
jgi:putative oxidoreductase